MQTQRHLRTIAMTMISFHQVEHTYDRNFLLSYVSKLREDLRDLVRPHLTDKSLSRIDQVTDYFSDPKFLDALYLPDRNPEVAEQMAKLMDMLNNCMEEGVI